MEHSRKNPDNLTTKRIPRLFGVGALAISSMLLTACNNPFDKNVPTQQTAETASRTIKPCPTDFPILSAESDGKAATQPYSQYVNSAIQESKAIYNRVKKNGGNITLNSRSDVSAIITGNELVLNVDTKSAISIGYEANISFAHSTPEIGIGSLVCNNILGNIFQTNFVQTLDYFNTHTAKFPTSSSTQKFPESSTH